MDTGHKKVPTVMKDANEGTSFEDVVTASVKRHLANDANDNKLYNASMMELIGHLSKDNKEIYSVISGTVSCLKEGSNAPESKKIREHM